MTQRLFSKPTWYAPEARAGRDNVEYSLVVSVCAELGIINPFLGKDEYRIQLKKMTKLEQRAAAVAYRKIWHEMFFLESEDPQVKYVQKSILEKRTSSFRIKGYSYNRSACKKRKDVKKKTHTSTRRDSVRDYVVAYAILKYCNGS